MEAAGGKIDSVRVFAKRRSIMAIAGVAVVLAAVPFGGAAFERAGFFDLSSMAIAVFSAVMLVIAIGLSLWSWRCPACSKSLGLHVSPKACGKCGAKLV